MTKGVLIIFDTSNLKILSKNIFSKSIENEKFILQNTDQGLKILLISDDIDLVYQVLNSHIYRAYLSDVELDSALESQEADFSLKSAGKKANISINISAEIMKLILKFALTATKIIVRYSGHKLDIKYKVKLEIFTIENKDIISEQNYTGFDKGIANTIALQINLEDFVSLINAHQCIHNYKTITGDNPQTQIAIEDNKIKILSTNYTIGLINYLEQQVVSHDSYKQLQVSKAIEINKIKAILEAADKIEIVVYKPDTVDSMKRTRSKFIKISHQENCVYIRLYDSDINLFNENILDDQLQLKYTVLDNSIFAKAQLCLCEIEDIKKIQEINIILTKATNNAMFNASIVGKLKEKTIRINSTALFALESDESNIQISMPGHTMHMINSIAKQYKFGQDCKTLVFLSATGHQGKIEIKNKYKTNIIFV